MVTGISRAALTHAFAAAVGFAAMVGPRRRKNTLHEDHVTNGGGYPRTESRSGISGCFLAEGCPSLLQHCMTASGTCVACRTYLRLQFVCVTRHVYHISASRTGIASSPSLRARNVHMSWFRAGQCDSKAPRRRDWSANATRLWTCMPSEY